MTLEQDGLGMSEEEIRTQEEEVYAQQYGGEENGDNGYKKMTTEEYEKAKKEEFIKRGRSRAPWTMVDDMEYEEMSANKGEAGPEQLQTVERKLENVSQSIAAGTVPMYKKVIQNRKLAYSDSNGLSNTAKQLERMAGGTPSDTERWMDTPEAMGVKGALLTETSILQSEEVVLKCLVPFTLGFHGWTNILGILQSRDRGFDPNDPESDEFFWALSRGLHEPGDFKSIASIEEVVEVGDEVEVNWPEAMRAETTKPIVPESEKRIAVGIDEAHRLYTAIAAVAQKKEVGSEGIGRVLNENRKRLIERFLTDREFKITKNGDGSYKEVTETESISNIFSMRQQSDKLMKVQRFVRACVSLGVWDRTEDFSGGDFNEMVSEIDLAMKRMALPINVRREGKIDDPYLLETKAEMMSLAMMRGWGLGALLGAEVSTERKYGVVVGGDHDKRIRINSYTGSSELLLKLVQGSEEREFSTGDTRAAGGDWDIRTPLMMATNNAYKSWNEGRLGLTGEEVAKFKKDLNTNFDRDKLIGIEDGPMLPPNLVVSFLEYAKVSIDGEKKSMFDLFLEGKKLHELPMLGLRGNEFYKWLIQMSQAKLVLEVVFIQDEDGRRNSSWEKFVDAPQGLEHLLKRVDLATGHNKDESEIWMAGLVSMMFAQKYGMLSGEYYVSNTKAAAKIAYDNLIGGLGEMSWRGDGEWGKRVSSRVKKMIDNEKKNRIAKR
jgi:hypothetical protein